MRVAFCELLLEQCENPGFVFLSGDLGFRALEPLKDKLGGRFINAGVAEQNMVSVAAGMAMNGLRPWVYSIAPFIYARAFEQIRNDVCLHNLPVVLVGNGGGYGYGVMGATHHALEDYGVLLTLPRMIAYLPAFDSDLELIIPSLASNSFPSYLRLGVQYLPRDWSAPSFEAWRKLLSGRGPTVVVAGPLAGEFWQRWSTLADEIRPNLWCLCQLPFPELPEQLWNEIRSSPSFAVVEEHVPQGSAGSCLARLLLTRGVLPRRFEHFTARGYPTGRYGSQRFHQRECGLDPDHVLYTLSKS